MAPTCTPPGHTHCHRPTASVSAVAPVAGGAGVLQGASSAAAAAACVPYPGLAPPRSHCPCPSGDSLASWAHVGASEERASGRGKQDSPGGSGGGCVGVWASSSGGWADSEATAAGVVAGPRAAGGGTESGGAVEEGPSGSSRGTLSGQAGRGIPVLGAAASGGDGDTTWEPIFSAACKDEEEEKGRLGDFVSIQPFVVFF